MPFPGRCEVLSASDGKVGSTWAPGLVRGGARVQTPPRHDHGALSTDSNLRFWLKGRRHQPER
ncbi:MAG: hypothetical protein U1E15_03175 [Hyphomicrobiales bacterium]